MTEQMKPSGIDWIGNIPNDWKIQRFKFCGAVLYGFPFNSDFFTNEDTGIPLIRIRDITSGTISTYYEGNYSPEYMVHSGDVLVGMDGDFNVRIWDNADALLNQRCCKIRSSKKIDARYLAYYLPHQLYIVNQLTWSTTVKHLLAEDIGNIPVAYPQLKEQQAIVRLLDQECAQIDSIAADLEKQIVLLQQYKKSLITETVTKGLDKSVPMKDSGIEWVGKIPEHWNVTKIKYFCRMYSGENLTSADIEPDGDYPVYGGNGKRGYYSNFTNDGEHVLVGRQGALCGNVHLVSGKFWATDHAVVTYPTKEVINKYLYYLLRAMNLNQYSQSAAQPGLAVNIILALKTCLPSTLKEQETIVDFLDDKCLHVDQIILQKERQFSILQQHKKSLIYEYVTGKKRVKEVQ